MRYGGGIGDVAERRKPTFIFRDDIPTTHAIAIPPQLASHKIIVVAKNFITAIVCGCWNMQPLRREGLGIGGAGLAGLRRKAAGGEFIPVMGRVENAVCAWVKHDLPPITAAYRELEA